MPLTVRLAIQNEHSDPVSSSQLTNLLLYHRSLSRPAIYSVDDLRIWCQEHSTIPDSNALHDVFVSRFYVNSCEQTIHPYSITLISTDEAASSYTDVLQTLKQTVFDVTGITHQVKYRMGDGGNVLSKCREHRKMVPVDKWEDIERDLLTIQLSFDDGVFQRGVQLLLKRWREIPDLVIFANYFEEQWVVDLKIV
ncbi:unnamed protein product [Didymodactylos carnosus]|uniref:Uncharacterized protein n=1 Tax=Didymodactylos carnosus TaxID=1234261 RepID=A0A814W552_9BILA|nr:unnamed protein product [Didymodactylos carnosus]CAF1194094.1 unnamed protein product [Didymodactylos carnosus]CAF3958432.1 unnamed protein product [Didymodactylos carnosus]CAF3986412.1 unnamed protein product [Didymodactylos carnosus]